MNHSLGLLEHISAVRIQVFVFYAEVVMDGSAFEDALSLVLALAQLEVPHLQNHTQTLHEEDAAEYGQKQFLVDDDGAHGYDAADGQ